jgi:hypothetical protein
MMKAQLIRLWSLPHSKTEQQINFYVPKSVSHFNWFARYDDKKSPQTKALPRENSAE